MTTEAEQKALDEAKKLAALEDADEVDVKKDSVKDKDDQDADDEDDSEDDESEDDDSVEESLEPARIVPALDEAKTNAIVNEGIVSIFEGETLSEDFKTKVSVIYEAAVKSRLSEEIEKIEVAAQAVLAERVEALETKLAESVDGYLDLVVSQWLEDNKVAVEEGLRTDIAESFMNDLHELFVKHNIEVPEEKLNILEASETENAELKEEVNTLIATLLEVNKEVLDLNKEKVISKLSEGLAATQVEKFITLTKDLEAKDATIFEQKAKIIRENLFKEVAKVEDTSEVEGKTVSEKIDPSLAKYLAVAKKLNKAE